MVCKIAVGFNQRAENEATRALAKITAPRKLICNRDRRLSLQMFMFISHYHTRFFALNLLIISHSIF